MILKNNYYCFIAGLPEVFLDDRKLALSVNGFRELAREALKKEDYERAAQCRDQIRALRKEVEAHE